MKKSGEQMVCDQRRTIILLKMFGVASGRPEGRRMVSLSVTSRVTQPYLGNCDQSNVSITPTMILHTTPKLYITQRGVLDEI